VSCKGPPASSALSAVGQHSWNRAVHRSSSTSQARTQFPTGLCKYLFQQLRLLVRSVCMRFDNHLSAAAGRRRWPFVLRPRWLVLSYRCRAHPRLTPSFEFSRLIMFLHSPVRHHSHTMLPGVVPSRSSELSSVVGLPHAFVQAPLWSGSGHSLGNVLDFVPVRPSSVETALSQSYGRGFIFDGGKIHDSSTRVFPAI